MKKKRMANFEERKIIELFKKAHCSYLAIEKKERTRRKEAETFTPLKKAA